MRRAFLALLAALGSGGFTAALRANGGPEATGIPATGDGTILGEAPRTTVSILDEELVIDLRQEFAAVRLRYRMRNAGGAVEQAFYFPVESWEGDVERYAISADGSALEATFVDSKGAPSSAPGKVQFRETESWDAAPTPIRRWRKSVIPFAAGQERELLIRYRSAYARHGVSVSDNEHMEARFFAYRFSPAAAWREPIRRGKVTVNALLPEPENVELARPAGRFARVSPTQWEWSFRDLRPTQADDLRIITGPAFHLHPAGSSETDDGNIYTSFYRVVGPRAYLEHADYDAKASSTLAPGSDGRTYDVQNLRRRFGGEAAWAEGAEGDGIGESLTFRIHNPLPLAALLIRPGFHHPTRKSLWFLNNRVAACEITLNGEHTFTALIPDEQFSEAYPIPVRGYSKPVKTASLVIRAVHRGTMFRQTCISYLGFRAKLSKPPKIEGVR